MRIAVVAGSHVEIAEDDDTGFRTDAFNEISKFGEEDGERQETLWQRSCKSRHSKDEAGQSWEWSTVQVGGPTECHPCIARGSPGSLVQPITPVKLQMKQELSCVRRHA